MKFVHILVEGQTEETFVKSVLNPYLLMKGVSSTPIILTTKRIKSGLKFKGGVSKYEKIRRDILHILEDTSAENITTMFDYYGLPDDFPGKDSLPSGDCFTKIAHLEKSFASDIENRRFIPFLMLHEFETLIFVSPEEASKTFPDLNIRAGLEAIKSAHTTPEEINEGPETHPARRIENLAKEYKKSLHGPLITRRIGIDKMLVECPHFNQWIQQLE